MLGLALIVDQLESFLKKDGTNYFSKWSNADSIKTKKGFTYPDPGYRTFYNATANYYEFQSPSVPTYVTVNGKTDRHSLPDPGSYNVKIQKAGANGL